MNLKERKGYNRSWIWKTFVTGGRANRNRARIARPIKTDILQWGTVGTKVIVTCFLSGETSIELGLITLSCSNVRGYSGSFMERSRSADTVKGSGQMIVVVYKKEKPKIKAASESVEG